MQINIGIRQEYLTAVSHSLGRILADEFVLYTKTRKAHWCVTGPDFHSKHLFFESQYQQLEGIIDDVAERIRALGHFPPATLKEYLAITHLTEISREKNDATGYIKELLIDHESILIHLRENIDKYATAFHDAGSSDYITGLMETHEKMAWRLRAHLE
ncbi:DNA starvation/stationary phase protection protein [Niastella vici]|uniref:DNA starvation/stationary phase protection protein n=1 Tax=Niastella vici TaxID=1703345 RepID=A0A1V9FQ49_9BACT|nr:DNA starvation/stationary phase protection protein [Niastella vici]OQP60448.1 DNA starvation/stationary phase protection protein [Niastella vici]